VPKLPADDARLLASRYFELAVSLGRQRFASWDQLSKRERERLESLEWTLLTYSSDFTTRALVLAVDDLQRTVADLAAATKRLRLAAERTDDIRTALGIATAAVSLGAAVFTGNPVAIATALVNAVSTATAA